MHHDPRQQQQDKVSTIATWVQEAARLQDHCHLACTPQWTLMGFACSSQADKFHKTGKQLRSKMWWQNFKMKVIIVIVVLILIFVIFLIICFSGGNCFK